MDITQLAHLGARIRLQELLAEQERLVAFLKTSEQRRRKVASTPPEKGQEQAPKRPGWTLARRKKFLATIRKKARLR